MEYRLPEVHGVGGWLAFFLVTLGIFTPLRVGFDLFWTFSTPNLFGEEVRMIRIIYGIGNGSIIAIAGFVTWRLLRVRNWRSVRIAVTGLWSVAIFPHAFEIIAMSG